MFSTQPEATSALEKSAAHNSSPAMPEKATPSKTTPTEPPNANTSKPLTFHKMSNEYPAYQAWVENGGLIAFADSQGLKPDFLDYLANLPIEVTLAYGRELERIPGLRAQKNAYEKSLGGGCSVESCYAIMEAAGDYGLYDVSSDEEGAVEKSVSARL
ncbi:hypothetical protein BU26DRAFT_518210 [Trematosphaeria pertusa]|uniref:Uncharacterized protein n=1 Tax=Trematosphaeria pertusa TaxID=390896 RepID=A0A6A6IHT9_9PLEO|nr:uncharacterized protein BU26DRAFT_518210 [Trematosphaeria pertusa]KAF2249608.1 hypothetical protein BU26DRAFT_518210 [Trematosphaeria pertusa]